MLKKISLITSIFLLVACGGDDDRDGPVVDGEGIRENIYITNLSGGFPWWKIPDQLKRWVVDVDGLIPVKHNNIPEAIHALEETELKMGMMLFDRNSIMNTPDEDVVRGIVFSFGTAVGPNGPSRSSCGHVGSIGGGTGWPTDFHNDEGHMRGPLQVNIGSDHPEGCINGADLNRIAVHEVGHALGLGPHFEGFGIGPAYDDNMWNVLYNMYRNAPLTTKDNLVIEKEY
jgi:hypothetical protein